VSIYETTFIVNPQSDDASLDQHVQAVAGVITGNGGQILRENRMGTRRLAYEIQGLTQGYYASFIFEAPASVLPLLDRHFKLEEPYIRYLTIRFEGTVPPEEERVAEREPEPERAERPERPAGATVGRRPTVEETDAPAEVEEYEEEEEEEEEEVAPKTGPVPVIDESLEKAPEEEKSEEAEPEEEGRRPQGPSDEEIL
jgi:small subunit ribosomal protein S6